MSFLYRIAIILSGSLASVASLAAEPLPRSILIIDQSVPGMPFYAAISSSIRTTISAAADTPISIYFEQLELNRFSGPIYEQSLRAHFRAKYGDRPIGAIIAVGSAALEFVLRSRAELWPEVPVIFALVDGPTVTRLNLPPDVTGNTVQSHPINMLMAARAVVPDLKRVALVGDPPERQTNYRYFKEEIPVVAADLDFIDLTGLPMTELRKRVAALPDRTAILYTSIYSDGEGHDYIPADSLALVAEVANRPVVTDIDSVLGRGAVGGFIITGSSIGEGAARVALRILNGESASSIPIKKSELFTPVFDWRQLQRFGISEAQLPPGSEIRFRQVSIWDQYGVQIIAALVVLLAQTVMISLLLLERRGRHFAELQSRGRQREVIHLDRVAAIGAMSASIAHELNQPLGAILANVETAEMLLAANPVDRDQLKEILADIRQSDQRAGEIIAHMRGLLKKRTVFELQEFDLNDALRNALHTLEPEARKRGVLVRAYLAQGPVPVRADPVHLEQVILNLAANAMDAMQDCTPDAREMALQTALVGESEVEVSVSDCGTGVPNDKLESVFDAFYTTKQMGTGLGLSIVRTIVETSGGKIWAENRPVGRGAVFRFTLPLIEAHAA